MDFERLHRAVRTLAEGDEVPADLASALPAAQRDALSLLERRMRSSGSRLQSLVPPSKTSGWVAGA